MKIVKLVKFHVITGGVVSYKSGLIYKILNLAQKEN
jgi:hypothetical protein